MQGYFLDQDTDVFERTMRLNYLGSVFTAKAAAPAMVARGSGHIILVSSGAAAASFLVCYTIFIIMQYKIIVFSIKSLIFNTQSIIVSTDPHQSLTIHICRMIQSVIFKQLDVCI